MEDLAGRLCEAVENEDAREVEDLLKCGADPNLVLPNGIAAIHLASGKESECALRCLTLILQHGGNPNIRSTDDLTPVHVAASWGCCKALLFLLRKGGDPSIQDQDGNTALDLALMENNRRCVVALQEYKERIPGGCADEIRDCHKNYSTAPDEITEMSCISLLLEPTYENSPLSSTKISPMMIFPKTLNPLSHMNDAVISSQAEMPYLYTKNESRNQQELGCSFKSMCELNPAEAKEAVPGRRSSQSGHCTEYFSTQGESDLTLDNSSISKKTHTLVDHNWENNTRNTVSEAVSLDIDSAVQQDLKSHREVDVVCGKLEGLDVTSPDHVYTYKNEPSEECMEKTLILVSNVSECKILEAKETYCRSNYSNGNTSLWDSGHGRWGSDGMDSIFYDSGDATVLSKRYECKTMNAQSSGLSKENLQAVENERLIGACTQIASSQCNRTHTVECTNKTIRTSEVQFTSQSSTVPIEATSEHDGQDLQIHLRDLLLSTKAHKTGSQAVCTKTIPVIGETRSPNQKDASSSSSTSCEGSCFVDYHERRVNETGDSELHQNLKKMMLATNNSLSPAIANEDKSPFFTPRTKSRLHTFKIHQNSSSLFDDSVEMPKRGRRVKSPGGLASPTHDLPPGEFLPRMSSYSPSVTHDPIKRSDTCDNTKDSPALTLMKKIPQHHGENLSEAEATISITNFLTDDLSSETEEKSCLQLKQATSNHGGDGGFSDSAWLTEDGESEISGVAAHKKRNVCSTTEENSLPASLSNRSFFHSTLLEDTVVNSCKPPRYSFSRISLIPRVDGSTVSCLSTLHDSASQELPLSPGGRPVNVSQVEPVEYLYKDNEKGHVLIEKHMPSIDHSKTDTGDTSENTIVYDWRNYKINTLTINKATSVRSPNRVAVELYRLSNDDIARRLGGFGEDPGQVTSQNRKMCILLLDKCLKEQTSNRPTGLSFKYSPELSLALHTFNISDCNKDEAEISREFDQPDKTRKWREGVLKSSFNYLLLDPRVTRNLPSRCRDISPHDCFRTFVSSVFYVGKGKRSRPYCHLYEALTHYRGSCKKPCSKVQHIIDIWKSGQGVLSLHCFQNTIPVEAYTREACMVDAIGLKMLTNQKKGVYYGQAQNWSSTRQQRLGVHLLYKAMQIFLAEGERQLRPPDIRSGQ